MALLARRRPGVPTFAVRHKMFGGFVDDASAAWADEPVQEPLLPFPPLQPLHTPEQLHEQREAVRLHVTPIVTHLVAKGHLATALSVLDNFRPFLADARSDDGDGDDSRPVSLAAGNGGHSDDGSADSSKAALLVHLAALQRAIKATMSEPAAAIEAARPHEQVRVHEQQQRADAATQTTQPGPLIDASTETATTAATHTTATTTTHTADADAGSRWDLLPSDIQCHTIRLAGPLTAFLCGMFDAADFDADLRPLAHVKEMLQQTAPSSHGSPSSKTQQQQQQQRQQQQQTPSQTRELDKDSIALLWRDAFNQDWRGDLAVLPDVELTQADTALVRSRDMYFRLGDRYPHGRNQRIVDEIPLRNMWLNAVPLRNPIELAMTAVKSGYDHVRQLDQHAESQRFRGSVVHVAASWGHTGILRVLLETGEAQFTSFTMDNAAANGNMDAVRWLHSHRTEGCTSLAMDWAAQFGHLAVIQWLHAHRREGCTLKAVHGAAKAGHLEVVQWLVANRREGFTWEA
ncbi:hypothetical protein BC831DRAFT_475743 [Entophlyctis helioformis]|nr:hypothetical protein BC831DRAFT_475743 [Entophlyctis helioformis]